MVLELCGTLAAMLYFNHSSNIFGPTIYSIIHPMAAGNAQGGENATNLFP